MSMSILGPDDSTDGGARTTGASCEDVSLKELLHESESLVALLRNPHIHDPVWNIQTINRLQKIHILSSQILGRKIF